MLRVFLKCLITKPDTSIKNQGWQIGLENVLSEPEYAYKRYPYKKTCIVQLSQYN